MKKHGRKSDTKFKCPKSKLLAFVRGLIHGLTRCAGINEAGEVSSGYIQGLQRRYVAYAARVVEGQSASIHPLASEAQTLLLELSRLSPPEDLPSSSVDPSLPVTTQRTLRRSAQEKRKKAESDLKRKDEILEQLVILRHKILTISEQNQASLLYNAKRLEEIFSAYGSGVLRKRHLTKEVPQVNPQCEATALYDRWGLDEITGQIEEVTRHEMA